MSQTPHKPVQKMCKSPKNSSYQTVKQEKIDYENLNTNCTVVGSNNLNLVKKPQIVTNMSPAYSNPSPGYPPSPYSSPASLKSPSPSLKPPTPQPNYPVMQIIHNNLLARPIQASQPQNIIKLKPHLNILPKPSASPQPSPKPSVSPQIVIPTNHQQTTTLMPTAQPLLLNQMPMLTTPGVQFILRPQAATKLQPQMQTATATPQGLILQPSGQQLLQIQPPRSQPMVRVLTNGMQLQPSTTTYVTQVGNQPISATHLAQQQQTIVNNTHQHHQHQQVIQQHQVKKKPKHKVKKKLDLANIMKLSGIGDEDDIQFESDTSQSESEHNSVPTTPQPQQQQQQQMVQGGAAQANYVHADAKKNIQNIQISAMAQPTINAATPVVQVLNQNFQSGMISNSTSQAAAQAGIPFNSFIAPNFTINNGLMLQRSGGFKLTMGEDGRLVLQHDPTLNQDIQSQIILQSLLGLNGGLVLQPSMDQQTVQQTVQTIQQQSVQTIQQQTVQSQTIQTVQQQTVQPQQVQHAHIQQLQPQIQQQTVQQTIQHQTVNALQQPMQIVQPQPIHSIHSQVQPMHSIAQSQVHSLQSQIQGQIQSLLQQQQHQQQQQQQQQSHAVQTQTVQHSHVPTLQNIQHQNVAAQQNIQQQNVQSVHPQPIPSPVHSVQGFGTHHQAHTQTQPVLKVQPFQKSQPPVQTVQPIQHHSINHQQQQQQQQQAQHNVNDGQSQNQNSTAPTSYVVNLTPDQLEQLKRNGQLTVNGQTIFMQRPNKEQSDKKMSPKSKPMKKVANKIQSIKNFLPDNPNDAVNKTGNNMDQIKETPSKTVVSALNAPPKHILPQNHVQPIQSKPAQPQAKVQPSVQIQPKPAPIAPQPPKHQQKVAPTVMAPTSAAAPPAPLADANGSNAANPDVDKLLGQILDETGAGVVCATSAQPQQQRITTIQLTPQKQQHLKSIQLQIQTLSARMSQGDSSEMQNALKLLFQEQQKILASGKLLPPDKVYYHNNQLTIVNPSSLNLQAAPTAAQVQVKSEPPPSPSAVPALTNSPTAVRSASVETQSTSTHQPAATQTHTAPRISAAAPTAEHIATQTVHHHPHPVPHPHPHHHHNHPVAAHHHVPHHQQQQQQQSHPNHVISQRLSVAPPPAPPPIVQQQAQHQFHSLAKKAHLIETQLNLDQNGAVKPDIHTPFRDKKDACIRLIRYHCFDQPVLSEKDLDKADEIFELTARHFIGKYAKMVDKYKYLLMKESMRQVQTSELMMLDRMFLAEEQQSLMKLRQDYENELLNIPVSSSLDPNDQGASYDHRHHQHPPPPPPPEDYDEWACIQRELGCFPQGEGGAKGGGHSHHHPPNSGGVHHSKRSASSDSRLETLKRFRVDKHNKKPSSDGCVQSVITSVQSTIYAQTKGGGQQQQACGYDSAQNNSYSSHEENETENNSIDEQVQSAIDSILNLQQNTALDLDSILS